MKIPSPSLAAGVIVVVSCLVWNGAITVALVYFLDLTAADGWIIAGLLGGLAAIAVTLIRHGIRHAALLRDNADPDKSHSHLFHAHPGSPANAPNSGNGHPRR